MAGLDDNLIQRAAALSSATLHEASGREGALPHRIKPLDPGMKFAGRALPVRCPAGDNLQIHYALAQATANDVLVVHTGDDTDYGYWGEIMATAAIARGVAALVITGGVRDSRRLVELGLPTFAGSISIKGTGKDKALDGAVGDPVRIGEIVVRKGDLIMGDADGIVCFPDWAAQKLIADSEERDAKEAVIMERLRQGALTLDVYKF